MTPIMVGEMLRLLDGVDRLSAEQMRLALHYLIGYCPQGVASALTSPPVVEAGRPDQLAAGAS